jgi:peptidoglycan hydrolase CwlO-like protein
MIEVLTSTGALILFFSWIAQQFLYEEWNARLSEMSTARRAFATYQSHNTLFYAIAQITPSEQQTRLWELQNQNYQFGLDLLHESLSEEQQVQLQSEIKEQEAQLTYLPEEIREMQAKIIVIQTEHHREKELIAARKRIAQRIVWSLYVIGTLLVIASQLLGSSWLSS